MGKVKGLSKTTTTTTEQQRNLIDTDNRQQYGDYRMGKVGGGR